MVLLGIGDSVTAGLGASRRELSYFSRLVRNPADEFTDLQGVCLSAVLPHLDVQNIAVSGSNSIQHLTAVERLEAFPGDVLGLVVMTTGGNDLIHWYGRTSPREGAMYGATLEQARPWIDSFEQRLHRMLDMLPEKFPGGCEVFLGDIYDPSDGVGDAPSVFLPAWPDAVKIHAAYNAAVHNCVEQHDHVHLVPIHENFLGHGIHCTQFWRKHYRADDPHYWYYDNLEDPNDRGYDALRRLFLLKIAEVLGPQHVTSQKQLDTIRQQKTAAMEQSRTAASSKAKAGAKLERLTGPEGATIYLASLPGGKRTELQVGKPYTTPCTGHQSWIGNTKEILLTVSASGDFAAEKGNLLSVQAGHPPRVVSKGYRFAHVGVSRCGRLFSCDDFQGAYKLVIGSTKTGKSAVVCESKSSPTSSQNTHPHPYLTPDLKWVIFNSNRSGFPHVYAASVPPEMVQSVLET